MKATAGGAAAACVLLLLVATSCRSTAGPPSATSSASPEATESPTATPTPRRPRVEINTTGPTRKKIARAVRDLRRAGIWRKLATKRLYVIEIQARAGTDEIPKDGHLADANLSAFIDDDGSGGHCFILFFPAAIRRGLSEWNVDAAAGFTPWRPPSERVFWAAILAHELAHCQKGQPGEKFAYKWTGKAFTALGRPDLVEYAQNVYEHVRDNPPSG